MPTKRNEMGVLLCYNVVPGAVTAQYTAQRTAASASCGEKLPKDWALRASGYKGLAGIWYFFLLIVDA
jgi:hypothetical protein